MAKGFDKKMGRALFVLAIVSFVITFLEGILYYSGELYQNQLFRFMLILQNSIKAFGFKTTISIENILKMLNDNPTLYETIIGYAYGIAIFTAPYCTVAVVYKMVERWWRIKGWLFLHRNKRHMIVFGYNEDVKILLLNKEEDTSEKKIHLVASKISQEEELELLRNGIEIHKIDVLKMPEKKLVYFLKRMELKRAEAVILFEEASAKNFSIYYLFNNLPEKAKSFLNPDVKFYVRCEDEGIRRMMEDYYDEQICNNRGDSFGDLEMFSIPELRVRKMFKEHKLHTFYKESGIDDVNQWNLHLLIVGFGKLGQQILLQAMNQGVTGSKNSILIDVVDVKCDEKQSIFGNYFNEDYVRMNENEYTIPSENADGELRIRFHKMDIRFKNFQRQLWENGDPEKDGIYTYVALCVNDPDVTLHCMSEVQRYFMKCDRSSENQPCIAVRMDLDNQMAKYLEKNKATYKDVFVINDSSQALTMKDLLNDELDKDAKEYNYLYNSISIEIGGPRTKKVEKTDKKNAHTADVKEKWKKLALFRRDSNRALAAHASVKEDIYPCIVKEELAMLLDKLFGENGTILENENDRWVYHGTMKEFVELQSDETRNQLISEISRLEHRRWCYFMATRGWTHTKDLGDKKNDKTRENPCMCTWEDLVKHQSQNCCYDLMPLLLKYKIDKEDRCKDGL